MLIDVVLRVRACVRACVRAYISIYSKDLVVTISADYKVSWQCGIAASCDNSANDWID